jgi:syntaxin-binding protein 1
MSIVPISHIYFVSLLCVVAEKHDSWKVLIIDEHAMRVISCSVGMFDIMERKVTVVESLEKKRGPFPDMDAIYVLNPCVESIDRLLDDFERPKPLYGKAVFLYFLGHLPDALFDRIKACKQLIKRVKGFSEINVDFLPKEERAFTFAMTDLFPALYLRKGTQSVEQQIAERLVTVCGTLNEYPHIRYTNTSASRRSLATLFKIKMDDFVAQNPQWWYHGGPTRNQSTAKERGTLLLLDRADDCLTPLMHDFTYQAMVYDLLDLNGDMITYANDKGTKTDVLLDEKDAVWVELRGKHIAQVIETLSDRIKEIMNSSTGSTLNVKQGQGNLSLSQMAAALKALPEYQEVMSKLSQHMHLSHECMDIFTAKHLIDVAEIEQTLATGKDEDDRSPRIADAMEKVEESLLRMKTLPEKLRLVLIAVIACEGLRAQDKRRLTAAAELTTREMRIFDALEVMGLAVESANDKNRNLEGLPQ